MKIIRLTVKMTKDLENGIDNKRMKWTSIIKENHISKTKFEPGPLITIFMIAELKKTSQKAAIRKTTDEKTNLCGS